jgi:hypothetical protein
VCTHGVLPEADGLRAVVGSTPPSASSFWSGSTLPGKRRDQGSFFMVLATVFLSSSSPSYSEAGTPGKVMTRCVSLGPRDKAR